ncbi:probable indole-3-pyruvate monooxygenase YUCCA10 [Macadamia integrifolia]|uniref:probable indole-3-pyruvate monooxygenase YUCCA10 n=1 Tax=Macadamia integrifolia TaxID=60698 RepID=UPI001C4EBA69|nr:probable indole-3-pyruvate monooxygenase YUCCA10 [Macadamia integrifolia]
MEMSQKMSDDELVIVAGAGPSGIATSACLNLLSIPNIVLEREDCCAPLWQKKSYDRLHLHLPKQSCELPHMPFPSVYPKYVPKQQFIEYLEDYVNHFKVNIKYNRSIMSATYDELTKTWCVKAMNTTLYEMEEYKTRFLIIATGETCDPFIPEIEGLDSFKGEVLHSTQYKSGDKYRNKSVLVVGCGNSGMEIAFDLSDFGAKTSIVVRNPVHILSKEILQVGLFLFKFLPFKLREFIVVMLCKLWFGDMTKYGITRPVEGPFTRKMKYGKFPVIDVGTAKKIKSGEIQVLPGITTIKAKEVTFKNGYSYPFDAIVFATGFQRSTNKWLKDDGYLLDDDGFSKQSFPNHWKGRNGLYCAGLARRGLYGSGMDAQNIANHIKTLL